MYSYPYYQTDLTEYEVEVITTGTIPSKNEEMVTVDNENAIDYETAYHRLAKRFAAIEAYLNVGEIEPGKKLSYLQDDVESAMETISHVETRFLVINR
jgi:hypothetical protein